MRNEELRHGDILQGLRIESPLLKMLIRNKIKYTDSSLYFLMLIFMGYLYQKQEKSAYVVNKIRYFIYND